MNPNDTPQQPTEQPTPETPAPATPVTAEAVTEAVEPPQDPTPQPVAVAPAAPVQGSSKALAIWALVLGILAFITGFIVILSIPLTVAGLVVSIIALLKHHGGRGMSIAGLVLSVLALIAIPFWITVSIVAYNGIAEKAKESSQQSQ